jgi:hypothetical protein
MTDLVPFIVSALIANSLCGVAMLVLIREHVSEDMQRNGNNASFAIMVFSVFGLAYVIYQCGYQMFKLMVIPFLILWIILAGGYQWLS